MASRYAKVEWNRYIKPKHIIVFSAFNQEFTAKSSELGADYGDEAFASVIIELLNDVNTVKELRDKGYYSNR